MKKENGKEEGVSPVIGVMLLLVVTVVIAAVVVGFSTGLAGSTGTTPTALFEVSTVETFTDITHGEQLLYLNIRQKGGDTIPLSDLQITLTSVGGANSGITQTLVAIDEKRSFDATAGSFEAPPQSVIDMYEYWKQDYLVMKEMFEGFGMPPEVIEDMCGSTLRTYEEEWGVVFSDPNDRTSGTLVGKASSGDYVCPVTILGQEKPTESVVSTGDIIHIVPFDGSSLNSRIFEGTSVKWTISYIPTNSIIAKGEFEVIAD